MERITWDQFHTRAFCEICREECEVGNRLQDFFSNTGWKNVIDMFFARTGKRACKKQLKNKWDTLKKDYAQWMELKNSATGLGWNDRTVTIEADEEWWKQHLKHPTHKKWRAAGPPNLREMEFMFENAYITGALAATARTINLDAVSRRGRPIPLDDKTTEAKDDEEEVTPTEGQGDSGPSQPTPQYARRPAMKISTKRKTLASVATKADGSPFYHLYKEAMDKLTGSGEASSVGAVGGSPNGAPSIPEALKLVRECGVEEASTLFHTATRLMLKPEIQLTFASIESLSGRLFWLEREHELAVRK